MSSKEKKYKCHPFFAFRTPLNPFNDYFDLIETNKDKTEYFLNDVFLNDKRFQESILISSKSLYQSLVESKFKYNDKQLSSLLKYYIRDATRTTPYGLSAGISKGTFSKSEMLNVGENSSVKKIARPDMEWLFKVIKKSEDVIGLDLKVKINNTILNQGYKKLNTWTTYFQKSTEETKKINREISIDKTKAVQMVFDNAMEFISVRELIQKLEACYEDVPKEIFTGFINSLIDKEFLISNLRTSLVHSEQFDIFVKKLNEYKVSENYFTQLIEVKNQIEEYNQLDIGDGIDCYQKILKKMECMEECKNYLQVDMYNNENQISLNYKMKDQVEDLVGFLSTFADFSLYNYIEKYKLKFLEKYGYREVRLLEVIDEVSGIGMPEIDNNYYEPYIEFMSNEKELKEYMLNEFVDCIENKGNEIRISEKFIARYKKNNDVNGKKLPRSTEIALFPVKDVEDKYIVSPLFGSTVAGESLGRFINLFADKKSMLNQLKKADVPDGEIEVEVTYIPQKGRLGNVLICETFRDYILEFGTSGVPLGKETLDLDDIYVGIYEDQFYFRSLKLNKKVTFNINNKVNRYLSPPLLRFLIDVSKTRNKNMFTFFNALDKISSQYIRFPRISYKNFILSPAEWLLDSVVFKKNNKLINRSEFYNKLKEYREKHSIPCIVFAQEGDQRLLLNLEDKAHCDLLYSLYKKNEKIRLVENNFKAENLLIEDNRGNSYLSEFVFFLERNTSIDSEIIEEAVCLTKDQDIVERNFFPFSKWLYLKLYVHPDLEDEIISKYISKFTNDMLASNLAQKFFFIRYKDSRKHLRIRFELNEGIDMNNLLKKVSLFAKELKSLGVMENFSFDSYEREIERYGGENCIELAEEFFYYDSMVVMDILKKMELKDIAFDKFKIIVISICKLMHDAGIPLEKQFEILDSVVDKNAYKDEFRPVRKEYMNLLNSSEEWKNLKESEEGCQLLNILEQRRAAIKRLWDQIERDEAKEQLANTKRRIMLSLIHMHFNRFFGINREEENKGTALVRHSLSSILNYRKAQGKNLANKI